MIQLIVLFDRFGVFLREYRIFVRPARAHRDRSFVCFVLDQVYGWPGIQRCERRLRCMFRFVKLEIHIAYLGFLFLLCM